MTMNAIVKLLAIACILFSTVYGQGKIPSSDEIDATMSKFNKERRAMAKTLNISNMNRLSWDDGLAKTAASLACVTQDNYTGPGRVLAIDKKVTLTMVERDAQMTFTGGSWALDRYREAWLHPLQTQIGCAEQKCTIGVSSATVTFDRDGWCVMGPLKKLSKDDVKEGPAGSGCGSMKNEDGLCVPAESERGKGSFGGSGSPDSAEGLSILTSLIVVLFAKFAF